MNPVGRLVLIGLAGVMLSATSAPAGERFWILLERFEHVGENCPDGVGCTLRREFTSRLLQSANSAGLYRLFGILTPHAPSVVAPSGNPLAPRICDAGQDAITVGFDPLDLPESVKTESLRGVRAVYTDLRQLAAPPGFSAGFGEDLHTKFVERLESGGIKVLDKNAITQVPGQPRLNLYFSFTDPEGICEYEYSVFASLTQEVLLARNMRIKITAGVWSFSTSSTARDHSGNERDAILRVADAFVRDHRSVNPK